MIAIALKGLRGTARRLVGTLIAIVLGVSFMAGVRILADTTRASFDQLFATVGQGIDVVVRAVPPVDRDGGPGGGGGGRGGSELRTVPVSLADEIRRLDGVAAVQVVHETRRGVVVVDRQGQPTRSGPGAPFIATGWPTDDAMNPYRLEGRPPSTADEVVLDRDTAEVAGAAVGDEVTIRTPARVGSFRLVGTVTLGDTSGGGGGQALFAEEVARGFNPTPGEASRLQVRAVEGVDPEALRAEVAPVVAAAQSPRPLEAVTGTAYVDELRGRIADILDILNNGLVGFAALSLFVGAFIISNTFSILVTQRQRELALLRAVGASRRQVVGSVLIEALVVGAVAGVVGVAGGIGLARALSLGFDALGIDLPTTDTVLTTAVAATSVAIGLGMALACAWLPARRASRIPPVAALRDVGVDRTGASRGRAALGAVAAAAAIGLTVWGLGRPGSDGAIVVGIATAVAIIAAAVLGPVVAVPVARLVGAPLGATGVTGRMAARNARRNPRRTASTAAALMIGVAVVTVVLVMSATLRTIVSETTERALTADVVVTADAFGRTALTPDSVDDAEAVAGVDRVGTVTFARATVWEDTQRIAAVNAVALDQASLEVDAGTLDGLGGTGIAVAATEADRQGVEIGDEVAVTFIDGTPATLEVRAIVGDLEVVDTDLLISDELARRVQPSVGPSQLLVDGEDGTTNAQLVRRLRDVPSLLGTQVQDVSSFAEAQASSLDRVVGIFLVLLALTIVIALFGIANTLSLSVHERTRELGLLRAVGTTRRQISTMVRQESVILALLGTTQGAAVGLVFGWALARTLVTDPTAPEGLTVVLPWGQLALVVVVAAVSGLAASAGSARRARQLDVLTAIATE